MFASKLLVDAVRTSAFIKDVYAPVSHCRLSAMILIGFQSFCLIGGLVTTFRRETTEMYESAFSK